MGLVYYMPPSVPAVWSHRREDLCELKTTLVYVGSRPGIHREPLSVNTSGLTHYASIQEPKAGGCSQEHRAREKMPGGA